MAALQSKGLRIVSGGDFYSCSVTGDYSLDELAERKLTEQQFHIQIGAQLMHTLAQQAGPLGLIKYELKDTLGKTGPRRQFKFWITTYLVGVGEKLKKLALAQQAGRAASAAGQKHS